MGFQKEFENQIEEVMRNRNAIPISQLSERSFAARDRALHVLAAMRHDQKLSLTRAASLQGVKRETVKKYFSSALSQSGGRFRVARSDRFVAFLNLPDEQGNVVLRKFHSSKERGQAHAFLEDLNRFQRGKLATLGKWRNVKLGGFGLLTDPRTIKATEPALSEFSLYRTFNAHRAAQGTAARTRAPGCCCSSLHSVH
jgi:hypothetical protein